MQSFLHRPAVTPAIFAGVGAVVLIIAIYLANTFAECTIDLILHDEKDTTARRGANIYIAGTAAGLALLGAAAFYMEHRFVQRQRRLLRVWMGMGMGMGTGMATIMGMDMGMIMDTNTGMGMITDTDMDTDIEGGKTAGKETIVKVMDQSYHRNDESRYAAFDYGPRYTALDGPDRTVGYDDKGPINCLDGRNKVYLDEDELDFEDPGHFLFDQHLQVKPNSSAASQISGTDSFASKEPRKGQREKTVSKARKSSLRTRPGQEGKQTLCV
ncbi:hypothetical protein HDU89_003737 [Geranomyces variabilis]|nr:hypothetical protein HDU89_003737 [Geranomyces variabilis]